ncbi:MAG: plastocyanin/azurin family copper-binding protein [Dehalococcoidia bacterium]
MKQVRYRWLWLALGGALAMSALLAVACGEEKATHEGTPAPAAQGPIQIRLGEMYFEPDEIRLQEGQQVTIELINEGAVLHEFMVGREVEMHNGTADGYEHDFFEGVDVEYTGEKAELEREEEHGTEVELEAGGKGVLTFTVPTGKTGEWEIGCFIPGHYEAGMKGKLIVEE